MIDNATFAQGILVYYAIFSQGIIGLKLPKGHWHSQRELNDRSRLEGSARDLLVALNPISHGKRWHNIIIMESQFYIHAKKN